MELTIFNKDIFNHAYNGIAVINLKGEWIEINNSFCNLLGYSKQELNNLTFKDITHPEDLDENMSHFQYLLDGVIDTYQTEKRYFHKSGEVIWTLLCVSVIKDQDNKAVNLISQIIDITKRKRKEKEAAAYLKLIIDQNNRFKDFTNIINHDLRTHIGNIETLASFMIEEKPSLKNDGNFNMIKDCILNLNTTLAQLNDTITNNLSFNKRLKTLQLHQYIEKTFKDTQSLAKVNEVQLINTVSKEILIQAEPAYLNSILLNFITNAIKYKSKERDAFVKLSSELKEGKIRIIIEDNGLGMELEKYASKLFEPHTTFHNHKDSRGVGLFITKKHIELLGGTILIESKIDVGTTFIIELPTQENQYTIATPQTNTANLSN